MLKRLTIFLAIYFLCVGLPFMRMESGLSAQAQETTPEPTAPFEDFYGTLPTLEALFRTNGGCELPCWWGFRLGEVSDEEWLGFLRRENLFNVIDDGPQHELGTAGGQWSAFIIGNYDNPISSLFDENGTLIRLGVTVNEPRQWLPASANAVSFPSLLNQLDGIPEVYIFSESRLSQVIFLVIDDAIGLTASYWFDLWDAQPDHENYWDGRRICLGIQYTTRIEINMQLPEAEPLLSTGLRSLIRNERPGYLTIEEAALTRMDTEDFVQFFREHPDECLVIDENGRD